MVWYGGTIPYHHSKAEALPVVLVYCKREHRKVLVEKRGSTGVYLEMYQDKFLGQNGALRHFP